MSTLLVLLPEGTEVPHGLSGEELRFIWYSDEASAGDQLRRALGRPDCAGGVILSDRCSRAGVEHVASVVEASGLPFIEVRSERWDGIAPSPLSAACTGIIAGFGTLAVAPAVDVLRRELMAEAP